MPEFYIPPRGAFGDLWVSLTQPTRKGSAAEVRTPNPAAVFVFTPQASLALCFLLPHMMMLGKLMNHGLLSPNGYKSLILQQRSCKGQVF